MFPARFSTHVAPLAPLRLIAIFTKLPKHVRLGIALLTLKRPVSSLEPRAGIDCPREASSTRPRLFRLALSPQAFAVPVAHRPTSAITAIARVFAFRHFFGRTAFGATPK